MKILVARFWNNEPSKWHETYRDVIGLRRLSSHRWEVRRKSTTSLGFDDTIVSADECEFEMVDETAKCFVFDSTEEAYGACQTRDDIKNGDMLVIPSEQVVGLAGTWPVAVTDEHGELHFVNGDANIRRLMTDVKCSKEQVNAAVRFAQKHNWIVSYPFRQEI